MIIAILAYAAAAEDRVSLWLETGFGSPTGLMGGRAGWSPSPRWAVEAGGGLGGLGYKAAIAARRALDDDGFGPGSTFSVALGPVFTVYSQEMGFALPEPGLYWSLWIDPQVAWEVRAKFGLSYRIAIGVSVHLADNQGAVCASVPQGRAAPPSFCNPMHWPTGPLLADGPILPHFGHSIGWSF